jgi:excisionase family DNA binding protein
MERHDAPAQSLEIPTLETPREIARALKCTPQHVNALHRRGIIPAVVSIGRMVRFNRREVIEALAKYSNREAAAVGASR